MNTPKNTCDVTSTSTITEQQKAQGFHSPFGTVNVRRMDVSIFIIHRPRRHYPFGVYVRDGVPAAPFWKDIPPLVQCDTLEQAKDAAASIWGMAGSGELATVINCFQ